MGQSATISGTTSQWSGSYTLTDTQIQGVATFSITIQDLVGNITSGIVSTTNSTTVTIDNTLPTVTLTDNQSDRKVKKWRCGRNNCDI